MIRKNGMIENDNALEERLRTLVSKGITIIDPRQTYISPEVNLDRIYSGCVLYPGTRLTGEKTLIGSFAKVGSEGPATIHDSMLGSDTEVASGFLSEATLLPGARAGSNCHFRAGTLLEENVFTGHSVGLKQSILMYSVVTGSLINFCDTLISGGRSRSDHSEVGSGFIHFNFTPWGKRGDKATPSLIGNVTEGVFLDKDRIFLGGLSGIVGPQTVGFGSITVAGQVIREAVADSTMHSETGVRFVRDLLPTKVKFSKNRLNGILNKNIEYIAQLTALKCWYSQVRLERSRAKKDMALFLVLMGAIETIQICITERIRRYNSFAEEWSLPQIDETLFLWNEESAQPDNSAKWNVNAASEKVNAAGEKVNGAGERVNTTGEKVNDAGERVNAAGEKVNGASEKANGARRLAGVTVRDAFPNGKIDWKLELAYDEWIWGLAEEEKQALRLWLNECAEGAADAAKSRK